ncbi:HTH_Tnp_Tc3_2 domain-containing protein [Trichonephila clavipes]|nr:HTH_Tnp_Tc3_2 domain-containing protein [Trichonephila clavipes]
MFSDEFSLQSDSRWTLIWRAPGTRYHQENTIERHRYGGAGWLAFGEELFLVPELTCMFRVNEFGKTEVGASDLSGFSFEEEAGEAHWHQKRKIIFGEADPPEANWDRSPRTCQIEEFSLPQQWVKKRTEVLFPLPPNRHHGKETARGGKRGHHVTCVISMKKLDNCPRLRLVNFPTFRLRVLFPRPGNIVSGRISCSKIPESFELANMVANDAKVTKLITKIDVNLAVPPRFRQVLIESPL